MSTKKEYFCNFCGAKKLPEEMKGFYWEGKFNLIMKSSQNVEYHLCINCFEQIGQCYEGFNKPDCCPGTRLEIKNGPFTWDKNSQEEI